MAERQDEIGSNQGFTLIELLVVMLLTGIIATGVVAAVVSTSNAGRVALDVRENTDIARVATERIRDTVRQSFGVCDGATAETFTVWMGDANDNDEIDEEELVTFSLVDGELGRTNGAGDARALAFGLGDASGFVYLDRDAEAVPSIDEDGIDCESTGAIEGRGNILALEVTLSGDSSPGNRTGSTEITSRISLRNAARSDGTFNPNRAPNAIFTHSCSGRSCTFDAGESFDEDGSIADYLWDFGDGSTTTSGEETAHDYATFGSYTVALTVVDNEGATHTTTQVVTAASGNATPSASFTVSCAGLTCDFDASTSYDSDGEIVSYEWNFDDENSGSGMNTSHTFDAPGSYGVSLSVTDDGGAVGTQVNNANPTEAGFEVKIAEIKDTSYRPSSSRWVPRVEVTTTFPDGAPAVGVRINTRFGPEDSTDLKSAQTNAQGRVVLQANGELQNSVNTYQFSVMSIDDYAIANPGNTAKQLMQP